MSERACRLHELPGDWLQALLAARRGAVPAPAVDAPIDWPGIALDASSHAIGVMVWSRMSELGAESLLPSDVRRSWDADNHHARLQTILQQRDAEEISRAFDEAQIRHAFLKGVAYRSWLYRPAWCRPGADLDLLIDRQDKERARSVMFDLGFGHASATIDYQNFGPATWKQIKETEDQHYELAQLVRTSQLTNVPEWLFGPDFVRRPPFTFERRGEAIDFHTVVDIHWAIHFMFAQDSPLERIAPRTAGELPRLSTSWNLLITAFKLYYEAFDRPYYGFHHLADLAAMLRTSPGAGDWELLDELVQKHGLWAPVFYTLSAASALAPDAAAPSDLLDSWSRTAPPLESMRHDVERRTWFTTRDCGDFIPYMIGRRIGTPLLAPSGLHSVDRHGLREVIA
jgi:hypothetical protein